MVAGNDDLTAIQEWIVKQPHLPQTLCKVLVERFLLSCDSSLERTKAALEYFFTMRTDCPEFFGNRDPCSPRMQEIYSKMEVVTLDGLTPEGRSCFILRFVEKNMETFDLADYAKAIFMISDLQTREELERVPVELVVIIDATNWNMKSFTKIKLTEVKKVFDYCQEAQPVKTRQVHIINPMLFLDKVVAVFRPFLKSEILDMLHIHATGSDSLYQHVPRDILPLEFGGHAGTVKDITERVRRKLESGREWLEKNEWMADESKRVGKRNRELRTEMEGSFRTLSID